LKSLGANWPGVVFFFGAWFAVPIFIGKLVIGADWTSILIAYLVWVALLIAFALMTYAGGSRPGEAVGWPLIFSIFLTIGAIPIILVILRATGLR
jgi:hypothetical protein